MKVLNLFIFPHFRPSVLYFTGIWGHKSSGRRTMDYSLHVSFGVSSQLNLNIWRLEFLSIFSLTTQTQPDWIGRTTEHYLSTFVTDSRFSLGLDFDYAILIQEMPKPERCYPATFRCIPTTKHLNPRINNHRNHMCQTHGPWEKCGPLQLSKWPSSLQMPNHINQSLGYSQFCDRGNSHKIKRSLHVIVQMHNCEFISKWLQTLCFSDANSHL